MTDHYKDQKEGVYSGFVPSAEEKSYEREISQLRAKLAAAEAGRQRFESYIIRYEAASRTGTATELQQLVMENEGLRDLVRDKESELSALREDKERLDWLSGGLVELRWRKVCAVSTESMDLRQAIDQAMKQTE